MNAKTLTVTVNAPAEVVYALASNPLNLPEWAHGLALAVRQQGDDWFITTSRGDVKFSFLPQNRWGLLDHQVELSDGTVFNNPMRVIPNGEGSEVMFTLFQSAGMSDAQFEADASLVLDDLNRLKSMAEQSAYP